jgi:hypothetical protein
MTERSLTDTERMQAVERLDRDEIHRVLEDELGVDIPLEVWEELSEGDVLIYLGHLSGCIGVGFDDLLEAVGIHVTDEEGVSDEV